MRIALVHDYLTQRGGAERAVLAMLRAFPGAPLYTSLYEPALTFPEFRDEDVRTTPLNRAAVLRHHHRVALPLLAPAFSRLKVDADVALCASSGWAHGADVRGRKIVYCHTPARWLYQTDAYLARRFGVGRLAMVALGAPLRAWDRRAAASAHRFLTGSNAVRARIAAAYGRQAEVLPCPPGVDFEGDQVELDGTEPGFFLVVSRLLAYKNVAAVVEAFRNLPGERLIVVGTGPEEDRLRATAPGNVRMVGTVHDEGKLRWLYAHCRAVVTAAYEDQGLIPVEAAGFGKPSVALRWGGFLDTVVDGVTGIFFDEPEPGAIAAAVCRATAQDWPGAELDALAERHSEERFRARLRQVVEEELAAS